MGVRLAEPGRLVVAVRSVYTMCRGWRNGHSLKVMPAE